VHELNNAEEFKIESDQKENESSSSSLSDKQVEKIDEDR